MFTNLVGFIKPLLKKDRTTTKTIAKVRAPGEDEQKAFKDFHEEPEIINDTQREQSDAPPSSLQGPGDMVDLSLAALKHLVEQSDAADDEKQAALQQIKRLELRGIDHLSVPPGASVITFLINQDI